MPKLTCKECGSSPLVMDERRGELICRSCGVVNTEKMVDDQSLPFIDGDHGQRIAQHAPMGRYKSTTLQRKDRGKLFKKLRKDNQ